MLIVPVSHVDLQASLMFCEHPGLGPWLPLANLVACLFERNAKFDKRSISKFVRRLMQVPTLNFNVSEVHCNRILHSICIFFWILPPWRLSTSNLWEDPLTTDRNPDGLGKKLPDAPLFFYSNVCNFWSPCFFSTEIPASCVQGADNLASQLLLS